MVLDVEETTGLVSAEIVQEATKEGGKVLILHETAGILPNL